MPDRHQVWAFYVSNIHIIAILYEGMDIGLECKWEAEAANQ